MDERSSRLLEECRRDAVAWTGQLVRLNSENPPGGELACARRCGEILTELGMDVTIDEFAPGRANVTAFAGERERLGSVWNGHLDTVPAKDGWEDPPFGAVVRDGSLWGRGSADMKSGCAAMMAAAKYILRSGAQLRRGLALTLVADEECVNQGALRLRQTTPLTAAACVVCEPTRLQVHYGNRGFTSYYVRTYGRSCHGCEPWKGVNAIYKMADILQDVRALNENGDGPSNTVKGLVKMLNPEFNPEHYEDAQFLGRGTCTTSQIFYTSPSRCAVADSCSISIDRRMTAGETWDSCLEEIRQLPSVKKYGDDVKVSMYMYDRPAWTGTVYETECFFPTWINKAGAAHVQALVDAHHALWGEERIGHADADESKDAMHLRTGRPLTDKWTFSTNCVSIQGRYGIPCVGFGPGAESQAHAPNEITWKQDLVTCAALYAAAIPLYKPENKTADVTEFRQSLTDNDIK